MRISEQEHVDVESLPYLFVCDGLLLVVFLLSTNITPPSLESQN